MGGGVHHDTVAGVVASGGEILIAGSAVFEEGNPRESARRLLESALAERTKQVEKAMVGGQL